MTGNNPKSNNETGFTLVELMIATSVFAIILLVITAGLIQVGRMFFKGVSITNTQEEARNITESISQAIQFSGESVTTEITPNADGTKGFCAGNKRYSYVIGKQLVDGTPEDDKQSNHVMVLDNIDSCNGSTQAQPIISGGLTSSSRELMGAKMRIANLELKSISLTDRKDVYSFKIRIISGDTDLLTADLQNCKQDSGGSQFCAASELSTTIQKRIE